MHELSLFENQEKWYTIEELADLCGLQVGSCKNILTQIWKSFQNDYQNIRVQNIGGHKNIKLYSENVLKAIKDYQLKNNAPNAIQNKEAAISGNISYIESQTVGKTIEFLLENPQATQLLLQKSLERNQTLSVENVQLKEIVEQQKPKVESYDKFISREQFTNLRDTANYLKIEESKFMGLLKSKYIYKNNIGEYRCYSEYKDFFTLRPFERNGTTHQQLMMTGKGVEYFEKKLKTLGTEKRG